MHSEHINELATALAKCQGEMSFAAKDSKNPHFNSKYADLSSVWDAIREPLSRNGLSVVQTVQIIDGKNVMVSLLLHSSGQWIKSHLLVKSDKDTCQGLGSALTYARRYSLAALVGCVQDDDDGNAAEGNAKKKHEVKQQKEDPKEAPFTKEQQKEMFELTNICEPAYLIKIQKWLESKGVNNLSEIKTFTLAENVIQGLRKNVEIFQKQSIAGAA